VTSDSDKAERAARPAKYAHGSDCLSHPEIRLLYSLLWKILMDEKDQVQKYSVTTYEVFNYLPSISSARSVASKNFEIVFLIFALCHEVFILKSLKFACQRFFGVFQAEYPDQSAAFLLCSFFGIPPQGLNVFLDVF